MKTLRILVSLVALAGVARAQTSITALPAIGNVTSSTVLPVVDVSGTPTTKKATAVQLLGGLPDATGSGRGIMPAADKAKLDASTASNTVSTLVLRDSSGNFAAGNITATKVTGLSSPVDSTDAANKGYVDAAAAGLVIKSPAVAGTIGTNITLSGGAPNTLDGVSLVANDRILVKNQTDPTENGIYFVQTLGTGSNGTWARTTDADTGAELVTGSYVFIAGGTVNANAAYTMVTTGTITIGTSPIVWNLFSQVTQIQASNILGQIVAAQIQDAAINTAKFAAGITPVEIVGTLPTSGNFAGRTVFLTSNSKLYRYDGSSFIATISSSDLTGQITSTQITDGAISTPKLAANSVVAGKIAAGAVEAGDIAASAVTAGTIAAGAVSTTELAAGAVTTAKLFAGAVDTNALAANAVTAAKIQAGTITADKMAVSQLSAITANLGTVTAGSLTASSSVSVGTSANAVSISSSGMTVGTRISFIGDGVNPRMRVTGDSPYDNQRIEINGNNGGVSGPFLQATNTSSGATLTITAAASTLSGGHVLQAGSAGTGTINFNGDNSNVINISAGENGTAGSQLGYLLIRVNGRNVKVPFYDL